jgi:polyhydroxyalkanoate synthesis regulator phasin
MSSVPSVSPTSLRIPKQVAARAARADALLAERAQAADPPPSVDPSAAAAPNPAPPAPSIESLLQAPSPEKDADIAYWRARANAVEGIRRAEATKAAAQVQTLRAEVQALASQIAELQTKPAAAAAPADQLPTIKVADLISPEQLEDIGEDRAVAIINATMKALLPAVQAQVQAATKPLADDVARRAKKDQEEAADAAARKQTAFIDALTAALPNWLKINEDPQFVAYCRTIDPNTGTERQQELARYDAAKNATGAINFFQNFLKASGALPTPAVPPTTPTSQPTSSGSAPPAPPGQRISDAEVREGYKAINTGKWKPGRDDAQIAEFHQRVAQRMGPGLPR